MEADSPGIRVLVVGAGITGLCLAQRLAAVPHVNVLVVERHDRIGGLHRSWSRRGVAVEHAPRVYSTGYTHFRAALAAAGIDFDEHFDMPYSSGISAGALAAALGPWAAWKLGVWLATGAETDPAMSIAQLARNLRLDASQTRELDSLCRRVDGVGASRFPARRWRDLALRSVWTGEELRVPRHPLTGGPQSLFGKWQTHLEGLGVMFAFNTRAINVRATAHGEVDVLLLRRDDRRERQKQLRVDIVILAVPPTYLPAMVPDLPRDYRTRAAAAAYVPHSTVVFGLVDRPEHYTIASHPWNIVALVHEGYAGAWVLSATANRDEPDERGLSHIHCSEAELISGFVRAIPAVADYSAAIVNRDHEPAFAAVAGAGAFPISLPQAGVFTAGPHTVRGGYPTTSAENAALAAEQCLLVLGIPGDDQPPSLRELI